MPGQKNGKGFSFKDLDNHRQSAQRQSKSALLYLKEVLPAA
jgi:hypothetical protein